MQRGIGVVTHLNLIVLAMFLFPACSSPTDPSDEPVVSAAKTVTLQKGATAKVGALTLTFAEVVGDSRCPANVQCIWAGDGAIRVTLEADSQRGEVILHTHGGDQFPKSARWRGYEITLEKLEPEPRESRPDASSYRAHFSVRVQTPSQSSGGSVA